MNVYKLNLGYTMHFSETMRFLFLLGLIFSVAHGLVTSKFRDCPGYHELSDFLFMS